MQKISNEEMQEELRNLNDSLTNVGGMLEVIKDSCESNNYANQYIALEQATKILWNIVERMSALY